MMAMMRLLSLMKPMMMMMMTEGFDLSLGGLEPPLRETRLAALVTAVLCFIGVGGIFPHNLTTNSAVVLHRSYFFSHRSSIKTDCFVFDFQKGEQATERIVSD